MATTVSLAAGSWYAIAATPYCVNGAAFATGTSVAHDLYNSTGQHDATWTNAGGASGGALAWVGSVDPRTSAGGAHLSHMTQFLGGHLLVQLGVPYDGQAISVSVGVDETRLVGRRSRQYTGGDSFDTTHIRYDSMLGKASDIELIPPRLHLGATESATTFFHLPCPPTQHAFTRMGSQADGAAVDSAHEFANGDITSAFQSGQGVVYIRNTGGTAVTIVVTGELHYAVIPDAASSILPFAIPLPSSHTNPLALEAGGHSGVGKTARAALLDSTHRSLVGVPSLSDAERSYAFLTMAKTDPARGETNPGIMASHPHGESWSHKLLSGGEAVAKTAWNAVKADFGTAVKSGFRRAIGMAETAALTEAEAAVFLV